MEKHRLLFVVVVALVAAGLFAAPASACCIPCQNFCTKDTDPNAVCCTGIPVPGDACGHTTCGKYLCGKRCWAVDAEPAPEAILTPLPQATPAGCQDDASRLFEAPASAQGEDVTRSAS
jgi:hypothetical protein